MASPHKPLPAVPTRYDGASSSNSNSNRQLSRLSIDGRAHLRNFVRYVLSEENVRGAVAEEWVDGIEVAMNELAMSMARGGWLASTFREPRALR
ncbi:hypothetical protein BD410DRAFT_611768 [Rickenella mellea]|uniref:Uncharacterized protein n=1 Tax=Rickenella mellea TaxID=50990 RepID=A0A4Y7PMY0_9AGAM|nr:hypothetical protein BD410DRAFT_611768 [Rickenella mellea]